MSQRTKRVIFELPPGGQLLMTREGTYQSVSLWVYWAQLAREHADLAVATRSSDTKIDAMSALIAKQQVAVPHEPQSAGTDETRHAMLAISSAAHAIDGFYGSVKRLVSPGRRRGKRARQILETLKLGFKIGPSAPRWLRDLDWLFDVRDGIVHHAEELRPVVVSRVTEETLVVSAIESYNLSAASAQRAADIAADVIVSCLQHPKRPIADWANQRGATELAIRLKPPRDA